MTHRIRLVASQRSHNEHMTSHDRRQYRVYEIIWRRRGHRVSGVLYVDTKVKDQMEQIEKWDKWLERLAVAGEKKVAPARREQWIEHFQEDANKGPGFLIKLTKPKGKNQTQK